METVPKSFAGLQFMQCQNNVLLADVNITELRVEVMVIRELKIKGVIRRRQLSRMWST